MEMIKCLKCEKDMPKLRLEKFGYKVCVDCSNISAYKAVNTTHGTGDHTWNDIIIMDQDKAASIARKEAELTGRTSNLEMLDFDKDEEAVSQSLKEKVNNILEDEKEDSPLLDLDELKEGLEGIDY